MRVDQTRSSATNSSSSTTETSAAKKSGRAALIEEGKKAQASKVSSEQSAKSEISPKAREFAAAKAIATQTPDVREEKVAALKRRIAEGKYEVDAMKVADRLVDDHLSSHLD